MRESEPGADPEPTLPGDVSSHVGVFDRFAESASRLSSRAWFFCACVLLVVVWAPSILVFRNIDTWQLIINSVTSIVTFLMVALLQNSQTRADQAVQHKLNGIADALSDLLGDEGERRGAEELEEAVGLESRESTSANSVGDVSSAATRGAGLSFCWESPGELARRTRVRDREQHATSSIWSQQIPDISGAGRQPPPPDRRPAQQGGSAEGAVRIMGRFTYEGTTKTEFEDRSLLHLQTVITDKLRRRELFSFTWRDDASVGDGRTTVWISPESALVFKYYGHRPAALNRRWLEQLAFAANSPTGLHLVAEPGDYADAPLVGQ